MAASGAAEEILSDVDRRFGPERARAAGELRLPLPGFLETVRAARLQPEDEPDFLTRSDDR